MAELVVRQGKNPGFSRKVPEDGKIVLGRRSANQFQVLDEKASRQHAEVFKQGKGFCVRDLKARNGTLVNGVRIESDTEIDFGDKIQIGDTVIELVDEASLQPIDFELPGYQLVEKIGEGSMGTVYKARQVSMDRIVALKVLNEKYCTDNAFIERFIREARSAGKLNHPNVIHVHDVNRAGNRHYFSMEYIDGTTVKKLLRKGPLPVDKALDVALQAAKALEFAHENQIIHRDVKPDNLMVSSDGVVKIADLGIAKSFDEGRASGEKRVFGTPHYMAPEQALGKSIDARVDIYALGATLYHMLTGETPFKGENAAEVLKAHVQDSLPAIQDLNKEVPDPVVFIVERMMAKAPEKRYAAMSSVVEDLARVIRDREAKIERIAAGDSSIQPAAASKAAERHKEKEGEAAKEKDRERKRAKDEEPAGLPLIVKLGIVAGILLLAAAVFVVVFTLVAPPSTGGGGTGGGAGGGTSGTGGTTGGGTTGGGQTAEKPGDLLAKATELKGQGDLDGALKVCNDLVARFASTPEADQAAKLAEEIVTAKSDDRVKQAAAAVTEAEAFERANPDDAPGARAKWEAIERSWQDLPQAAVAKQHLAALDAKDKSKGETEAKEAFAQAKRAADDRVIRNQFDAAIDALAGVTVRYSASPVADEAKKEIEAIKAKAKTLWEAVERDARDQASRTEFGAAKQALERFIAQVGSQEYRLKASALRDEFDKTAQEKYLELSRDPNAQSAAFRFDEAINGFRRLENVFRQTKLENLAKARRESVEAQKALHADVIKRINDAAAKEDFRELPFKLKGMTERWVVSEADEASVTLRTGRSREFARPQRWNTFEGKELYELMMLYYPEPTPQEHRWLANFCQDHDLTDQADKHFEKAGGAQ